MTDRKTLSDINKQRQNDRQIKQIGTHRQRKGRKIDRQKRTNTNSQTETHTEKNTDRWRQTDRYKHREKTDRQKQTDRYKHREKDRQTDTDRQI